jgi:iron(III) transport system ATP-binding protein
VTFLLLENLIKEFVGRGGEGIVRAVDEVNVTIQEGDFVTLLGPSGCGKTTTLRLIAGFEFPTAGRIVLDGEEINDQPPNQRDMAMVFQSYAIFPHLNVFENIAYGLKIQRLSRQAIRDKVQRVLECPTWMPNCVMSCAPRFVAFNKNWASPASMSLTTNWKP